MLEMNLRHLLNSSLQGVRSLKFNIVRNLDSNSRGFYAFLINDLRRAMEASDEITAAGFELEKPTLEQSRVFTTTRFPLTADTLGLVCSNRDIFEGIARIIVRGGFKFYLKT